MKRINIDEKVTLYGLHDLDNNDNNNQIVADCFDAITSIRKELKNEKKKTKFDSKNFSEKLVECFEKFAQDEYIDGVFTAKLRNASITVEKKIRKFASKSKKGSKRESVLQF